MSKGPFATGVPVRMRRYFANLAEARTVFVRFAPGLPHISNNANHLHAPGMSLGNHKGWATQPGRKIGNFMLVDYLYLL